ncbi:type IV pilus assembly protein PilM [Pelagirhabdus alkalitolerans]|uniref:Type IV pilus assembly protein PilM n=1 Tax=Pelagirhabdus alkalitolerans TaxID=1612202 RepID=A0A1G6HNV4_9BACI|nr:pilus assembly protein PilM [Pelagirhabdus alkalitolerans]SDB95813.1 type IV pilus assembly protein PilM [Pelagirhabdus alkalitolerans]
MFKRNKDVIVLDIGSAYTKVVVGSLHYLKPEQTKKEVTIKEMIKFETPKSDDVTDRQEFTPYFDGKQLMIELKSVLNDYGIKTKNIALVLGGDRYITRDIVIPKVTEDKILDMLTFEIEEYLPVSVDQYVIDYTIQEEFEEESITKYKVLVAALEKNEAKYYYDYLEDAGFSALILDAQFNGLSKLMPYMNVINGEAIETLKSTVACIDLGAKYIDVSLFDKGKMQLNRSIDNLMSKHIDESDLEAIEFDRSRANTLSNIERIFKFYTSRSSHNAINYVLVYGGGAENQSFVEDLAEQLNENVTTVKQIDLVDCVNSYTDNVYHFLNAISTLVRR